MENAIHHFTPMPTVQTNTQECTTGLSEEDHPTSTQSAPEQKIRQIIFTIDTLDAKEPDEITNDSTSTFTHPRGAVKVCGSGPISITKQTKRKPRKTKSGSTDSKPMF